MARTKTYNLALLQLSVGGRKIGGFGTEGGVTITWGGDLFDVQVGADGEAVASFNNDQSAIVEITPISRRSRASVRRSCARASRSAAAGAGRGRGSSLATTVTGGGAREGPDQRR